MRTRAFHILMILAGALFLAACNPEPVYTTRNVTLTMTQKQLSAGFVEYEYTTDKDAYYAIGVISCEEYDYLDPYRYSDQFMNLVLDQYYLEYITWRHDLLVDGIPYIADYRSHMLYYGKTDYYHVFLRPNKDYWAFAFVVDPETNKPVGDLVCETITTKTVSDIDVRFHYRVHGTWDYCYPLQFSSSEDTIGTILSSFPYMAATKSRTYLRERMMEQYGDTVNHFPAEFFIDTLRSEIDQADIYSSRVLYGEFAYNNVHITDDVLFYNFIPGETYYTAFAGCDGGFNPAQSAIYRFVWMGDSTRLTFTEKDKLTATEW